MAPTLDMLAELAAHRSAATTGVRLAAAADRQRREAGTGSLFHWDMQPHASELLRAVVDPETFAAAWGAGALLSADAAMAVGLAGVAELAQPSAGAHVTETTAADAGG